MSTKKVEIKQLEAAREAQLEKVLALRHELELVDHKIQAIAKSLHEAEAAFIDIQIKLGAPK